MVNLLKETLKIIENNGKNVDEIKFVRCKWGEWTNTRVVYYEHYMSWEDFVEQADRRYDEGYGVTIVKDDLQIVGKNWWLERHEYDGSEWWEFKSLPKKPNEYKSFSPFKEEGEW